MEKKLGADLLMKMYVLILEKKINYGRNLLEQKIITNIWNTETSAILLENKQETYIEQNNKK